MVTSVYSEESDSSEALMLFTRNWISLLMFCSTLSKAIADGRISFMAETLKKAEEVPQSSGYMAMSA